MGSTQYNLIPYPELTDPPDGPAQMKALADRVDVLLHTGVPPLQTGFTPVNPANVATITGTGTFQRAFSVAPAVCVNLMANAGTTKPWIARAINATPTGFTAWTFTVDNSLGTFSSYVGWIASIGATAPVALATSDAPEGWHYVTATCHTPECPKDGESVPGILIPNDPVEWGWTGITCGACGQPITDIVPS